MSDTTYYARIIKQTDLTITNGAIDGKTTEYNNLGKIERPWNNSTGPYTEEVYLTTGDGDTTVVDGHFLGSGREHTTEDHNTTPTQQP